MKRKEAEKGDGSCTIVGKLFHWVSKSSKELENEGAIIKKLQALDRYKSFSVDEQQQRVLSPEMRTFGLFTFERMQLALAALKELHEQDVVHGDLKPEHIRGHEEDERVCFVDFGFSGRQGEESRACTWDYASFERLLTDEGPTLSPIDDYEALFLSALRFQTGGWYPLPAERTKKNVLRWKLELMGHVASVAQKQDDSFVPYTRWLCQKLLHIWRHPRNADGQALFEVLAQTGLVSTDTFINDMQSELVAKFLSFCTLQEIKEETQTLPSSTTTPTLHQEIKEETAKAPTVNVDERSHGNLLREALAPLATKIDWFSGTANGDKYDSLFVLKGLQSNPSVWLKPAPSSSSSLGAVNNRTRFRTLTSLAGQVLLGEAGHGVKTIWSFLDKLEFLELRPLEYLLLFVGIHVSARGKFAPMPSPSFPAADGQCLELVSSNLSQSEGKAWPKHLASQLRMDTDDDDTKRNFEADVARAVNARYPCVGLATLIVAGRFFVERWREVEEDGMFTEREQSEQQGKTCDPVVRSTTARNERLKEDIKQLQLGRDILRAAIAKLKPEYEEIQANYERLQAQVAWLMQQKQVQNVWLLIDGQESSLEFLPFGATVGDLQQKFSKYRRSSRVFAPKSNPEKDHPLPPDTVLPATSQNSPLLVFLFEDNPPFVLREEERKRE